MDNVVFSLRRKKKGMLTLEGRTSFNLSRREIQSVYCHTPFLLYPHSLSASISEVAALLCPLKAIVVVAPYISRCSINKSIYSTWKKNKTRHCQKCRTYRFLRTSCQRSAFQKANAAEVVMHHRQDQSLLWGDICWQMCGKLAASYCVD